MAIKITPNAEWKKKYEEMMALYHQRKISVRAESLLKRTVSITGSIRQRSKKLGVAAPVTLEEIRQLIYENYGKKCKYLDRQMVDHNFQIDHIIPISKGGDSSIQNLQMISTTANKMKGSLQEEEFYLLINWLKTIPPHVADNIAIRLAGGKR